MADGTETLGRTVVAAEPRSPAAQPRKAAVRQMPKWEADARDQVRTAVRRFARPLADLIARDANEGDTRLLVTDFLCDGLGYDKYDDLTTEYQVKGEFADYGVRIAKQLVAFIEVKRCTTKLSAKHLRQVEMYAVNEGVEWMILTNGQVWQAWHLTPGMPVELDMALQVDLLGEGGPPRRPTSCSTCPRKHSSATSSTTCGGSRPPPPPGHSAWSSPATRSSTKSARNSVARPAITWTPTTCATYQVQRPQARGTVSTTRARWWLVMAAALLPVLAR